MTIEEVLSMKRKVARKLTATIALLLVASIMLGTSTYAWRVLSTAPEVTNVQTTAGTNGYLEIALQSTDPATQRRAEITAGVGDSVAAGKSVLEANTHWGNIVSLADLYGFESMVLYPSCIYVDENRRINLSNPVTTAEFGVDGRLTSLRAANKARYTSNGFTFNTNGGQYAGSDYGVNMLGFFYEGQTPVSSSVTVYDRKAVCTDMTRVMEEKRTAITEGIQRVFSDHSEDLYHCLYLTLQVLETNNNHKLDYTTEDQEKVDIMLSELEAVVGEAYESLKYALMAYAASDMVGYPDTEAGRRELGGLFGSYSGMTTSAIRTLAAAKGYTDITNAANAIDTMLGSIQGAKDQNDAGQIQLAVAYLVGSSSGYGIAVDGHIPSLANQTELETARAHLLYGKSGDDYLKTGTGAVTNTVDFWRTNNSGVFAPLADLIGDYRATMHSDSFTVEKITYRLGRPSTIVVIKPHEVTSNLRVTSGASASEFSPDIHVGVLGRVSETVESRKGSTTGTIDINQASMSKMTVYGYQVDLAFRCNEGGALKLESEALDRVLGIPVEEAVDMGRTNVALQGGGSKVSFSLSGTLTADQAKKLIPQIYVVFFSTQTGTVYGVATADSVTVTGTKATADLILHEPTYTDDGILKPGVVRSNQAIIASMQPNEPQYVSVIVYLNGTTVDSSMVASGGTVSLDGWINLQFANGTYELTPMTYWDFVGGE